MSTISTTNLKHPSSATNNITLASTGAVTVNGSMRGAGLDLVTSQSFSAVSSVSINNCFSSTYQNYRILFSIRFANASITGLNMRLRSSGSDNTASSYMRQEMNSYGSTQSASQSTTSFWGIMVGNSGNTTDINSIDLYQPNEALWTGFIGQSLVYQTNVSNFVHRSHSGLFQNTNQFDGFTIYPESSTISGNIRIYGYRNS